MLHAGNVARWNTDKDKHLIEKLLASVDEGAAFEHEAPWGDLVADVSAIEVGDASRGNVFTSFVLCFSLFGKCSFQLFHSSHPRFPRRRNAGGFSLSEFRRVIAWTFLIKLWRSEALSAEENVAPLKTPLWHLDYP